MFLDFVVVHFQGSFVFDVPVDEELKPFEVVLAEFVFVWDVLVAAASVVVPPVAETQPTELASALGACHVHAALVLLDVCFAVRARFRVLLFPRIVQGVEHLLKIGVPLFEHLTIQRLMTSSFASQAN